MRDAYHNMKVAVALAAAAYDDDATGATVDRLGFEAVTFALAIGAGGITFSATNKIEFKLEASDDASDWAAVAAGEVLGASVAAGGVVKALTAPHATADVSRVGYIGDRRYVRLSADFGGTHGAATPLSAIAVLGRAHERPVA